VTRWESRRIRRPCQITRRLRTREGGGSG
jgi:hypothetical protein